MLILKSSQILTSYCSNKEKHYDNTKNQSQAIKNSKKWLSLFEKYRPYLETNQSRELTHKIHLLMELLHIEEDEDKNYISERKIVLSMIESIKMSLKDFKKPKTQEILKQKVLKIKKKHDY